MKTILILKKGRASAAGSGPARVVCGGGLVLANHLSSAHSPFQKPPRKDRHPNLDVGGLASGYF